MKTSAEKAPASPRAKRNTKARDSSIQSKVSDFKRERIMEVAARLFNERGYRATTVDAIAGELEVTKPFIYYHFHNKEDIVQHLFVRTMDITLAAFEDFDANQPSASDALRDLGRRFVKVVIDSRDSTGFFWRRDVDLPELDKRRARTFRKKLEAPFLQALERGVESGEFSIEDLSLALICIEGMAMWTFNWYRPEGRLSADELADHIANLMVNMVRNQPPKVSRVRA